MTQRAVVNGNEVPLPATPNRTVQDGSGTFSCEGNVLQLSVEGLDALFLLNRAP